MQRNPESHSATPRHSGHTAESGRGETVRKTVADQDVEGDADPMEPVKPPYGEDADLPPKPGNPEEPAQ